MSTDPARAVMPATAAPVPTGLVAVTGSGPAAAERPTQAPAEFPTAVGVGAGAVAGVGVSHFPGFVDLGRIDNTERQVD